MVYRDELFKCFQGNVFSKDEVWDMDEDRVCRTDGAHLGNSEGGVGRWVCGVAGAQRKVEGRGWKGFTSGVVMIAFHDRKIT